MGAAAAEFRERLRVCFCLGGVECIEQPGRRGKPHVEWRANVDAFAWDCVGLRGRGIPGRECSYVSGESDGQLDGALHREQDFTATWWEGPRTGCEPTA